MGYNRAGFSVTGVDIEPQPRNPFEFVRGDALEYLRTRNLRRFDAIHASPPCQAYAGVTSWRGDQANHERLIAPIRELLIATGLPYVIENVQDARRELVNPLRLCGSQFGLRVRRHRYFETNWPMPLLASPCSHQPNDLAFEHKQERAYANAMGCYWMTVREAREAIPPAFTAFIGTALRQYLASVTPVPRVAALTTTHTQRAGDET